MFTNKKREGINTFVCAVSVYVAETPKASIKDRESHYPKYLSALSRTVLLNNLSRKSCIQSESNHSQYSSPVEALKLIVESKSLPTEVNDLNIELHLLVEVKQKLAIILFCGF